MRRAEPAEEQGTYYRRERFGGEFRRVISLPDDVDPVEDRTVRPPLAAVRRLLPLAAVRRLLPIAAGLLAGTVKALRPGQFLVRHRPVARPEVHRAFGELADAAAGTDRLVVDLDAGLARVV